jgi:ribosomal protein S27E
MTNQAGKRLKCAKCGAEVVLTKGGEGSVLCCGKPMEPK